MFLSFRKIISLLDQLVIKTKIIPLERKFVEGYHKYVGPLFIHQDKHCILSQVLFAFFGTVTSEHTCLTLYIAIDP